MTNYNPDNKIGANLCLVGYAAGPAKPPAYDKDGSRGILSVSIPINEGYSKDGQFVQTGTTWYEYTAGGEYAEALRSIQKGDKIRLDNVKQEVREYKNQNGETKLGITLRFGTLTVLESAGGGSPDDETPW